MFHFNSLSFEICKNIRLVLRLHSLTNVPPKFFLIPMLKLISSIYVGFFLLCLIYSLQIKNWGMLSLSRFV